MKQTKLNTKNSVVKELSFKQEQLFFRLKISKLKRKYKYVNFLRKHCPFKPPSSHIMIKSYTILKRYNYGIIKIKTKYMGIERIFIGNMYLTETGIHNTKKLVLEHLQYIATDIRNTLIRKGVTIAEHNNINREPIAIPNTGRHYVDRDRMAELFHEP